MYLQTVHSDLIHAFNTKRKMPRFCNSIPDGVSYAAKTLFYYHGVSEKINHSNFMFYLNSNPVRNPRWPVSWQKMSNFELQDHGLGL